MNRMEMMASVFVRARSVGRCEMATEQAPFDATLAV
jgi:hypothetical protein